MDKILEYIQNLSTALLFFFSFRNFWEWGKKARWLYMLWGKWKTQNGQTDSLADTLFFQKNFVFAPKIDFVFLKKVFLHNFFKIFSKK